MKGNENAFGLLDRTEVGRAANGTSEINTPIRLACGENTAAAACGVTRCNTND
jgi:hypothetical protein